jgi:hypothetical protein
VANRATNLANDTRRSIVFLNDTVQTQQCTHMDVEGVQCTLHRAVGMHATVSQWQPPTHASHAQPMDPDWTVGNPHSKRDGGCKVGSG